MLSIRFLKESARFESTAASSSEKGAGVTCSPIESGTIAALLSSNLMPLSASVSPQSSHTCRLEVTSSMGHTFTAHPWAACSAIARSASLVIACALSTAWSWLVAHPGQRTSALQRMPGKSSMILSAVSCTRSSKAHTARRAVLGARTSTCCSWVEWLSPVVMSACVERISRRRNVPGTAVSKSAPRFQKPLYLPSPLHAATRRSETPGGAKRPSWYPNESCS